MKIKKILICRFSIIEKNIFQSLKDLNFQNYKYTNFNYLLKYLFQKSGIIIIKIWLTNYVSNNNVRIIGISNAGIIGNQTNFFIEKYRKNCLNIFMLSAQRQISKIITYLMSYPASAKNGQNIIINYFWSL